MESTTLVAPDISCQHCQHAIESAIGQIDGVKSVTVDIPAKTVHVEYDPQLVTEGKIKEVMDDTGYTIAK
jgi:copper chaperone